MATKVKGLLKGLRYITQIFEEKDQEIQIGFPTDVKHVAHIGWDGPSANSTPTWMSEFKSPQESAGQLAVKELSAKVLDASPDVVMLLRLDNHRPQELKLLENKPTMYIKFTDPFADINKTGLSIAQSMAHLNEIPKSTCSPSKKSSDGKSKKSSRRHRSAEASGVESPAREGSSRNSRRSRNSNNSLGSESPSHDPPGLPKLRKKKGSTDGGSTKSSRKPRSKGQNSLTDMSLEGSENGSPMHTAFAREKGSEVIPAGIHI